MLSPVDAIGLHDVGRMKAQSIPPRIGGIFSSASGIIAEMSDVPFCRKPLLGRLHLQAML
jgi:hypothetical protein